MNKYAVIQIGPFQYKVEEGKQYTVPNFSAAEGKSMDVTEVLAIGSDESVSFGKPFVNGAKVTLQVDAQEKGEKINSFKYKSKSRYRKRSGHRKLVTKFTVKKISLK